MKVSKRLWKRPINRIKRNFADLVRGGRPSVVVSFPKSGRTWLELMLDKLGVEAEFTHDDSDHQKRIPFAKLESNKIAFRRRRVIFLMRDPRDVVVSGYFQATKRVHVYDGDISSFIRDERHGIEKIIRFNQAWLHAGPATAKDFLLVRYEDLRQNTFLQMKRIINYLKCRGISDVFLDQVISFAEFNNMQRLERLGAFRQKYGAHIMPGDFDDPESYKVRKGEIGGFVEYMSARDVAFCLEKMRRLGFEKWYSLDLAAALSTTTLSALRSTSSTMSGCQDALFVPR